VGGVKRVAVIEEGGDKGVCTTMDE